MFKNLFFENFRLNIWKLHFCLLLLYCWQWYDILHLRWKQLMSYTRMLSFLKKNNFWKLLTIFEKYLIFAYYAFIIVSKIVCMPCENLTFERLCICLLCMLLVVVRYFAYQVKENNILYKKIECYFWKKIIFERFRLNVWKNLILLISSYWQ